MEHPFRVETQISHGRLKSLVTLGETLGSLGKFRKIHQELRYNPYKLLSDLKKREILRCHFEFGPHWAEMGNLYYCGVVKSLSFELSLF